MGKLDLLQSVRGFILSAMCFLPKFTSFRRRLFHRHLLVISIVGLVASSLVQVYTSLTIGSYWREQLKYSKAIFQRSFETDHEGNVHRLISSLSENDSLSIKLERSTIGDLMELSPLEIAIEAWAKLQEVVSSVAVGDNPITLASSNGESPSFDTNMEAVSTKNKEPVIVLSLPKSGTTSTWEYFNCGKQWASHHLMTLENGKVVTIGGCLERNVRAGKPMFEGCGEYAVWTDIGVPGPICFYPSVHGLDNIAKYYPNATIMLVVRDTKSWYKSASSWQDGSLFKRWEKKCKSFPEEGASAEEWMEFYEAHTAAVRDFAAAHPSLTYIEVPLESTETGAMLEGKTGISASCWGDCLPNYRDCKKGREIKKRKMELAASLLKLEESNLTNSTAAAKPREGIQVAATMATQSISRGGKKKKRHQPETQGLPSAAKSIDLKGPILVMSLPKSGTKSAWEFFSCGHQKASQHVRVLDDGRAVAMGACLERNVRAGKPMLEGCGDYTVWTDIGVPGPICFYPSVHGLDNLAKHYPNATLMMVVRDTKSWYQSASAWESGSLFKRWEKKCKGFPNPGASEEEWMEFYDSHTASVRKFAAAHPSLTYVEVELEAYESGNILEGLTGISSSCWG